MFYEDDENVMVAEFGSGDILIAQGMMADLKTGTISLIDTCGKCFPINDKYDGFPDEEITLDTDINTVIRLVFKKPESIDVLIRALEISKDFMKNPKLHPQYKKMKEMRCGSEPG